MPEPRIRVKPDPDAPHRALVYRTVGAQQQLIGRLTLAGERYYTGRYVPRRNAGGDLVGFVYENGTYWFTQLTSALRYIVTGEPNDNGRMVVLERGDYVADNAPQSSFADIIETAYNTVWADSKPRSNITNVRAA